MMRRSLGWILVTALAVVVWLGGDVTAAANCSDVAYRLWQGEGDRWFSFGETVEVTAGREGRIAIYLRRAGQTPRGTAAEFGYPGDFGFEGRARDVTEHIRMVAQNAGDRQAGRLHFTAAAPGSTSIGYRINGVEAPGKIEDLPADCRQGVMRVEVVAEAPAVADSAELCRQALLGKLGTGEGGVELKFDPEVETFALSAAEEGVRGDAQMRLGAAWRKVSYSCTVNVSEGRVVDARLQSEDVPERSSRQLCRDAVRAAVLKEAAGEPGGVSLFSDSDFRGRSQTFYQDVPRLEPTLIGNDAASSARVAPGCQAVVYRDSDFRGMSATIGSDVRDLGATAVGNDSASSVRITCQATEEVELVFQPGAKSFDVGPGEEGIRGEAVLRVGRDWEVLDYECVVDTRRGAVTKATYDYR